MPISLPEMDPCYLCGLVEDAASWCLVERTDLTITVLNARQYELGQCMVAPLRHAPTLLDLTTLEQAAVMAAAQRIMGVFVEAFEPDGVLLYQNNGVGSGQEVPHFHMHVVPRRQGSDWGFGPPHIARLEKSSHKTDHRVVTEDKLNMAKQLRRACDARDR